MNLVEKLLKIDKGEFEKKEVKEIPSKMLEKVLGEKAIIKIESIDPQMVLELSAGAMDDEGNPIISKSYDTNAKIAAAAVIDPPLKDKELLEHLGAATPAEAAKKLFKGEVNKLAAEVNKMAGFTIEDKDIDEEIKN